MAVAMGAIRGFMNLFTGDWVRSAAHDESPRPMMTILDVLEPRSPRS